MNFLQSSLNCTLTKGNGKGAYPDVVKPQQNSQSLIYGVLRNIKDSWDERARILKLKRYIVCFIIQANFSCVCKEWRFATELFQLTKKHLLCQAGAQCAALDEPTEHVWGRGSFCAN